jgi:hypothetical protein
LLKKRSILHHESKFSMPEIGYFPALLPPVANEERSLFYPQGGRYNQRPPTAAEEESK